MEIVTSEEMRRIDRYAIRTLRIPSLALMEAAGVRVVAALERHFDDLARRRVLVACGKGNNGGDGLVVARHLHALGTRVQVLLASGSGGISGDARVHLEAARRAGIPLTRAASLPAWTAFRRRLGEYDLVVDALLGTGLIGPARGLIGRILEDLDRTELAVAAVDLPSGLSGDSAEVAGPSLRARMTVALGRPKIAHVLPPACLRVGRLVIGEIGIPPAAVASVRPRLFTLDAQAVAGFLPARPRDAHKGSFGHALIVAGSAGKAGAAALAARAALRSGAGLVSVATPRPVRAEVAGFAPEIMTSAIPEGDPDAALRHLQDESENKSAVGLGPGLGRDPGVTRWIRRFTAATRLPLVLDADGLNAFAGRGADLSGGRRTLVLTPHPGEMARLLGTTVAQVLRDRIVSARGLARQARAIVVLKGMASLVAVPDGRVFVNATGNPGMASGGTGDVLTGLLAGLLARGLDPLLTVLFGVRLHGLAGDLAAGRLGEDAMTAGDLIDSLPDAFREAAG